MVDGFAKSGLTRREYCEKHNIGISTDNVTAFGLHKKKAGPGPGADLTAVFCPVVRPTVGGATLQPIGTREHAALRGSAESESP